MAFKKGDRVYHPTHGYARIASVSQGGAVICLRLDSGRTKHGKKRVRCVPPGSFKRAGGVGACPCKER